MKKKNSYHNKKRPIPFLISEGLTEKRILPSSLSSPKFFSIFVSFSTLQYKVPCDILFVSRR